MSNRSIIVLSMRYSGGVALTRVMNILGVGAENRGVETGCQHEEIVNIHNRLLELFGLTWDTAYLIPDNWWLNKRTDGLIDEIRIIVTSAFSSSTVLIVHDPRICIFLPIWLDILKEIQCEPSFVIMVRDPHAVVRSLSVNDGIPEGRASLLWCHYNLLAEKYTRQYRRVFATYDALLSDWEAVLHVMSQKLSLRWLKGMGDVADEVDDVLYTEKSQNSLQKEGFLGAQHILSVVRKMFLQFKNANQSEDLGRNIFSGTLRQEIETAEWFSVHLLRQQWRKNGSKLKLLSRRLSLAEDSLAVAENDLAVSKARLIELYASTSWKFAIIVRCAGRILRWLLRLPILSFCCKSSFKNKIYRNRVCTPIVINSNKSSVALLDENAKQLNNVHKYESIFIIGNGLQLLDLTPLQVDQLKQKITIGVNHANIIFETTYLVTAHVCVAAYMNEYHQNSVSTQIFLPAENWRNIRFPDVISINRKGSYFDGVLNSEINEKTPYICTHPNIALGATHLAYIMGAKKIIYLGFELRHAKHFYDCRYGMRKTIVSRYEKLRRMYGGRLEILRDIEEQLSFYDKNFNYLQKHVNQESVYFSDIFDQYVSILFANEVELYTTVADSFVFDSGAEYVSIDAALKCI